MTQSLGDQIRARRQSKQDLVDAVKKAVTDYVDSKITAALQSAKTYVDNQLAGSTKTYIDQRDSALSTRIDNLIAHNGLLP